MNKSKIIAEIGVNHNGNLLKAKKLIDYSSKARADYAKFQIYKTENLVTKKALKSNYQKKNKYDTESQFQMLKKYEFNFNQHETLFKYCKKKNIKYLASPFDIESYYFLKSLNPEFIKIGSGEITNYFLLKEISKFRGELVLSTGMSNLREIEQAYEVLKKKNNYITLLYCCSSYPTSVKDIDLNIMLKFKKKFNCEVGFSDHTTGIDISVVAATLGVKYIEKHFTLNKKDKGPDHRASINFKELKSLISKRDEINDLFKSGKKKILKSEQDNKNQSRKSIVARINIKKGDIIKYSHLTAKRPSNGISPMKFSDLLGKRAKKNIQIDEKF